MPLPRRIAASFAGNRETRSSTTAATERGEEYPAFGNAYHTRLLSDRAAAGPKFRKKCERNRVKNLIRIAIWKKAILDTATKILGPSRKESERLV